MARRKPSDEKAPRDARLTIGMFTGWLSDRYHTSILSGVADVAAERDANLLCFVGAQDGRGVLRRVPALGLDGLQD